MKKTILVLAIILGLGLVGTTSGSAAVYVFIPNPANVYNLEHSCYYTLGIDWCPQGEQDSNVFLTFNNIRNWIPEENCRWNWYQPGMCRRP